MAVSVTKNLTNVTISSVGVSGRNGTSGTSGLDGTSGINGTNGLDGTSGIDGTNGSAGTSGISEILPNGLISSSQQIVDLGFSLGGETASTGDITFDGVKIIGAGSGSGDGNGYSTIEIVPDTNLYANTQYLVIDPTTPNHIHIRAGGTQDASNSELYLGAELNYVRVIDGVGTKLNNGVFSANFYNFQKDTDYDTAIWSTDEFGNNWIDITITDAFNPTRSTQPFDIPFYNLTQYPQNKIEVFDGTNYIDVYCNGQAYTIGNPYQLRIGTSQLPPTNPTSILGMSFMINTLSESYLSLEGNVMELYAVDSAYVYTGQNIQLTTGQGNIQLTTNDDSNGKIWEFNVAGETTFPGSITISGTDSTIVLPNHDTAPATPASGALYFNTTDSHFYGWNGEQWKQLDN